MVAFDGAYTFTLLQGEPVPAAARMPVLGNGTLALVPDLAGAAGLDTARATVAGAEAGDEGGGGLEAFHFCRVRVAFAAPAASGAERAVEQVLQSASFDAGTGTLSAAYLARDAADGQPLCTVRHALRALRHLPHFALHTIELEVPAAQQAGLRVFHEVRPDAATARAAFAGASIDVPGSTAAGPYTLTASAEHAARRSRVHLVSAYAPEEPGLCEVIGCNVAGGRGAAIGYTRLALRAPPGPDAGDTHTYRLHVLTGVREGGAADPARLLVQAALAALARGPAALLAAHEAAWADAWATDVLVDAKAGLVAGSAEAAAVARAQRALRAATYHLHACAANLRVLDPWAPARRAGAWDACVLPALLLLAPGAARGALERRIAALPAAREAARLAGLRGALLPGDGEGDALLWQASTPLRLAAGALAAANAWDYYRVSQDREWLGEGGGYRLLRDVADALCSAAAPRGDALPGVTLPHTVGLDESRAPAADNALTVGAARVALRCAAEAGYELAYGARPDWQRVRDGLRVPFAPSPPAPGPDIVIRDADSHDDDTSELLEPLLLLTPLLTGGAFGAGALTGFSARDAGTLQRNLLFWAARAGGAGTAAPANALLLAQISAQLAQAVDPAAAAAAATAFEAALTVALDACSDDAGWGGLCAAGAGAGPPDLGLAAALLLGVLGGLAGVAVTGGVSDTRFRYAPLGLKVASSAALPHGWLRLRLRGLGAARADYSVPNMLLRDGDGGGSGSGGGSNASSLVPWSTSTLTAFVF